MTAEPPADALPSDPRATGQRRRGVASAVAVAVALLAALPLFDLSPPRSPQPTAFAAIPRAPHALPDLAPLAAPPGQVRPRRAMAPARPSPPPPAPVAIDGMLVAGVQAPVGVATPFALAAIDAMPAPPLAPAASAGLVGGVAVTLGGGIVSPAPGSPAGEAPVVVPAPGGDLTAPPEANGDPTPGEAPAAGGTVIAPPDASLPTDATPPVGDGDDVPVPAAEEPSGGTDASDRPAADIPSPPSIPTIVPPPPVLAGAVPEPATWAMLLLGFGAVGAALRRRQRRGRAVPARG